MGLTVFFRKTTHLYKLPPIEEFLPDIARIRIQFAGEKNYSVPTIRTVSGSEFPGAAPGTLHAIVYSGEGVKRRSFRALSQGP